jgi:hypothetical protein
MPTPTPTTTGREIHPWLPAETIAELDLAAREINPHTSVPLTVTKMAAAVLTDWADRQRIAREQNAARALLATRPPSGRAAR